MTNSASGNYDVDHDAALEAADDEEVGLEDEDDDFDEDEDEEEAEEDDADELTEPSDDSM